MYCSSWDPRIGRFVIVFLALGAGCSSSEKHWYLEHDKHDPPAAWSYSGSNGPAHWGDLDPSYAAAKTGRAQSPIDIRIADVTAGDTAVLDFHYATEVATAINNGHTIEHKAGEGSYVVFDGTRYTLQQFHMHTPSEHTVDGVRFPMELHLVHEDDAKTVLVVSVLAIEGQGPNPLGALPSKAGETTSGATVAIGGLLPENRGYYHYEGSFTTPPCTEGVHWFVMRTPKAIPADFIASVSADEGANNRPTQPLNGRKVTSGGTVPAR